MWEAPETIDWTLPYFAIHWHMHSMDSISKVIWLFLMLLVCVCVFFVSYFCANAVRHSMLQYKMWVPVQSKRHCALSHVEFQSIKNVDYQSCCRAFGMIFKSKSICSAHSSLHICWNFFFSLSLFIRSHATHIELIEMDVKMHLESNAYSTFNYCSFIEN